MTQRKPQPGKAIDWTDDDMDKLAQITPDDIEEARALWKRSVPRRYRNLIDAQPRETGAPRG